MCVHSSASVIRYVTLRYVAQRKEGKKESAFRTSLGELLESDKLKKRI